ncbi:hypothetical protein ABZ611_17085 [Streptomyces sp. NPDC007861]|uniref:hypothetical protein n=1 Tax=Streptomyces sp. NPDC007861 TaxID=3154893 RepID=UPI0033F6F59D
MSRPLIPAQGLVVHGDGGPLALCDARGLPDTGTDIPADLAEVHEALPPLM